ncbi:MAG TPA: hypothetical protein VFP06_21055 [Acidimicrobiales bacterium]|nr:hypothetical protein [Acidimicrobiales bacterium]
MAQAEGLARDPGVGDRLVDRVPAPGSSAAVTAGVAGVAGLAERVRPTDLARDRRLPVLPAFEALLPAGGLRRGTTVAVGARPGVAGATSLAVALAAGASQAGSWIAAVGLGSLGLAAAAELGVSLERLVMVADPGRDREGWASVVAALVDGFDVVLVAAGLRAGDARRLVARVRERGAVLVAVGGDLPGQRSPLQLTVRSSTWQGLGEGWGHLQGRRVAVEVGGRGEAARSRRGELWLPGAEGVVAAVEPVAAPIPLRRRGQGGEVSAGPLSDADPRRRGAQGGEVSAETDRKRAILPTARPGHRPVRPATRPARRPVRPAAPREAPARRRGGA